MKVLKNTYIFIVTLIAIENMMALSYNNHTQQGLSRTITYPIRFTYIDKIDFWWPPQKIASSLGVPGYSENGTYNYIALCFWTCKNGPVDIVSIWDDPMKYFGQGNPFGKTKDEVQKYLKSKYNKQGIKIMISAFGATQFPTTEGLSSQTCATKLGTFVVQNNLDGVDIDWEDNNAMETGKGQQWLIDFTTKLRQLLPNHIISHAPQAPYFSQQSYKNGAYIKVNKQVGQKIDFYNVQFYNQGDNSYDSFEKLFTKSGGNFNGTSVKQINSRGVELNKIVVGKPVTTADATGTGWMNKQTLAQAINKAETEFGWYAGVMFWQFNSDKGQQTVKTVISKLKQTYETGKYHK